MLSRFSHVRLFATLWTVACQAPLSMGFCRQEYWSGLPCPSPGNLPYPVIEPRSLIISCTGNQVPLAPLGNNGFKICAGEDSWESLDSKEIKPVNPKGNQSWIFIGRTDAEAEAPILWPPDVKHHLIWKRPCCWARLRARGEEDDRGWDGWMASPGDTEGQGSLACCSPCGHKESDAT